MKSISVLDLKEYVPELSHLRMIDFINPENDKLIAPYLHTLGIDLDYPITYAASQHRRMGGKDAVIAYTITGDIRIDPEFLSSPFCTVEDRVIAAGYTDRGLAHEMASKLAASRQYDSGNVEGFPPDLTNPDETDVLEQIAVLEQLLLAVRGDPFNDDGSRKTLWDYHREPEVKKERKKRSKKEAVAI